MEQIQQLKTIRNDALARLRTNPDYKLLTSLDELIVELEGVCAIAQLAEKAVADELAAQSPATQDIGKTKETGNKPSDKTIETLDKAFGKMNADTKPNGKGASVVDLSHEINGGAVTS